MQFEYLGDPKFGIINYKNPHLADLKIVERLESVIGNSSDDIFSWQEALVGHGQKMPEYRDCVDFKFGGQHNIYVPESFQEIKNIYNDVKIIISSGLRDYQSKYNITMNYMEATNFIKYTKGQHFNIHSDHGYSYVATVSNVLYLNDGFSGGELWFPRLDIKWKPEIGDCVFFPSTFIYAHASLPVADGVKYSAVTMFDYNDDTHRYGGFTKDIDNQYEVASQ